jgi:rod shape-determining protein MreC
MKYVPNDDAVNVGERVVTSGMDKIFPRDLPIGTITEIKNGNDFKSIRIRPSANLSRLEEVIVLLTLQPLQLKPEPQPGKPAPSPDAAAKPSAGASPAPAPAPSPATSANSEPVHP